MSEWQPIETAPKDGTKIICFCEYYYNVPVVMVWQESDKTWRSFETDSAMHPSHWMPLMEMPK